VAASLGSFRAWPAVRDCALAPFVCVPAQHEHTGVTSQCTAAASCGSWRLSGGGRGRAPGRARARAVQPSQVPDFGITYNIQVGQAFGFNFGYGIVRQICAIGISLV